MERVFKALSWGDRNLPARARITACPAAHGMVHGGGVLLLRLFRLLSELPQQLSHHVASLVLGGVGARLCGRQQAGPMVLFISGSRTASFGTCRKRGSVFHFLPSLSSLSRIRFRSGTDARPAHQYSKYSHSLCISHDLGRAACCCRGMALSFISAGERNAASEDILIQ